MAKATTRLTNEALAFLTERHLAMLTTLRQLAEHCHGDERPECPIIEDLAQGN